MNDSSTSILCPAIIGRTLHLEALSQTLEQARGGVGQTVLISGDAGIGKSRLVAEAKARAVKSGFQILQGNCFESDQALPYAPMIDLLRGFCAIHSDAEISSAFGNSALDFIKLLPEIVTRLPSLSSMPSLEPEAEKRRLFFALLQFLTSGGSSVRGPRLIVIEDLHWSDDTSLDFLLYLARHLVTYPVALLLTYRSDEVKPALNQFLVELNRARLAIELRLQHLTTVELDGMLRAIFQMDHPVSAEFRQSLYALTEGNPFFIEETLKEMISSGSIFLEQDRWDHKPFSELHIPPSIQDTVLRRSKYLNDEARRLLELAAVAGRRFDLNLLQELTQTSEQKILLLIKELVAAQLVVEESADQFSFRHALTREAVYRGLLIRERKRNHGLVADAIERIYANSLEARVGNLAYHYYEAGVWEKALSYSQLAGEKAQMIYAPHTALEQFTRALEAAPHLTVSTIVLHRERGQAYETIGEFDKAQADYQQALKSAQEVHDRKAEWQELIDLGFLWAERNYQHAGNYFQQALELARQINDSTILAHSLNRFGNWHANVGDLDEALRYHRQALNIFQELNERRGLAETLDLLGMTSQMNGDLFQAVSHYKRAIELFRELDDRRGLVSSLATLALCGPSFIHDPSLSPFNLDEAIEQGEQALKIAQQIGWRSGEIYALHCLSICLGPQGIVQHAFELTELSLDISEEIGHDQWLIGAHFDLGILHLEIFALSQARQHLELALSMAEEIGSSLWIGTVSGYLASVCVLQNNLSRAETILAAELTADTPVQNQMQRLCWCARAELELARGEPDSALSIIDRLIASETNMTPTSSIPRLSKLRSDALIMLKRTQEAERELQLAQKSATERGTRSWSWRIHLELGKLYQSQSRRVEAEAQFSAAQNIVETIITEIQDQTLCEVFQAHVAKVLHAPVPVSPRQIEKDKFGGLTAREREVAALIAQGQSNREIAETLVVSERTVESHVTNILAKLNFSSRSSIAVWAAERGLGKRAE
jgi:tetratricopeptide (TPR) repeat protein/DNA-binding CsgD family transcriptional regulator